jgi:hypothetical protein
MSVDSDQMEHRWGTRVDLHVPAELRTAAGTSDRCSAEGIVRNASVSGAFVETGSTLPLLTRIFVSLPNRGGEGLDACVVRIDDRGLGVEWLDPGSRMVPALLSMRWDSCGDVLQTTRERGFTVLASSRN